MSLSQVIPETRKMYHYRHAPGTSDKVDTQSGESRLNITQNLAAALQRVRSADTSRLLRIDRIWMKARWNSKSRQKLIHLAGYYAINVNRDPYIVFLAEISDNFSERRISLTSSNLKYTLVGECYVHGFVLRKFQLRHGSMRSQISIKAIPLGCIACIESRCRSQRPN